MSNYSLVHVAMGLRNLLDSRRADLLLSKAGKYHEAGLVKKREVLDALPPALTGGTALSGELKEADDRHDGLGAAIYFATKALIRWPDATAAQKASAQRVMDAFVPSLGELQESYLAEAHRAVERRPLLLKMKDDLRGICVGPNESLLPIAKYFLDAGDRLNDLLNQRGASPQADRTTASVLRTKAVAQLNRLRDELREEIGEDQGLPRDLEHRVFGYFDVLSSMAKTNGGKGDQVEEPLVKAESPQ